MWYIAGIILSLLSLRGLIKVEPPTDEVWILVLVYFAMSFVPVLNILLGIVIFFVYLGARAENGYNKNDYMNLGTIIKKILFIK